MAFNSPVNCKMSDLGMCVAGTGSSTGTSTAQKSLRGDLAGGSASNVKLWASFRPGTRTITFDPEGTFHTFNENSTGNEMEATMNHSGGGTYWESRVLDNSTWLSAKWQANRTSGNDTANYNYNNTTPDTFPWTHDMGTPSSTDFWNIVQVIPSGSAFERFFCNTTGGNEIASQEIIIYDSGGGGV